jgi:hypothetical protein
VGSWRWTCGFLRIITSWALIWCTSSTQLCCVGSRQWKWVSSSYARSSYTGPMDWVKETNGFTGICFFKSKNKHTIIRIWMTTCIRTNLHSYIVINLSSQMCFWIITNLRHMYNVKPQHSLIKFVEDVLVPGCNS